MFTFEQVGELLDEIAEEFPEAFYQELNGGISLLPDELEDAEHPGLYILGEYCHTTEMGRYINIYYGSIAATYPDADEDELYDELYTTLAHEFTHHIESLAGERGLEVKDEAFLKDYMDTYEA